MADRYWVGGSGTWDASTTTNWATTSGGAGGASAPTSADNAYFDGSSDTGAPFTVTISTGAVCEDVIIGDGTTVTVLDQTMTLAGSATWTIYGSLFFPATSLSRTFAGAVIFAATTTGNTITTNGVTLTAGNNVSTIFNGIGGEWTLGSALSTSNSTSGANQKIYLYAGTLKTANYNITSGGLQTMGSDLKIIELGSSTFTVVNTSRAWNLSVTSGLTFDAGTSHIVFNVPGGSAYPNLGGLTYYDMTFNSNVTTMSLRQGGTFNNLTIADRSAAALNYFGLSDNITVNGTLTYIGSVPNRRILFGATDDNPNSDAIVAVRWVQRTITAAAVNITNADFRDIVAAGAASWDDTVDMTNCGDGKNNTGITFPAGKTSYRVGTGNWSDTQWASSSGGSPADADFPLAQDTCVFDANTTTGTHTINVSYTIGTLDMSAVTSAITLASGTTASSIYGNVTLDADVTLTGTGAWTLAGQGTTQTITSAGVTFTQPLTVWSPSGTVALADALTTNGTFTLTQGTLDITNQTLTCDIFSSSNSDTRSIAFGTTGKIVTTRAVSVALSMATATNFSYSGTSRVELTTGCQLQFGTSAGGVEANALNIYVLGSGTFIMGGGSEVNSLDMTGFTGNVTGTGVTFFGNVTIPNTVTFDSAPQTYTFGSTSNTQQLTTNGVTIDRLFTKSGAGTLTLADDLTMGSTRTFTLTQGTLALNGKTLTTGLFSSSNSNVREINFGSSGELRILEGGTSFNATTGTNLTTTGSGVIDLTSASSKTFAGGGRTYPTLNQGGSGALSITGANTFANVTNTVQPTTITFPSGVTTSVQDFSVSGTSGNLVTLNSSTPGTKWTIAKV